MDTHPDCALMDICTEPLQDVIHYGKDRSYRPEYIKMDDSALSVYFITPEIKELFIKSKPKDTKKMVIPEVLLEDSRWLQDFPMLKELETDRFSLKEDYLETIKNNTNIESIKTKFLLLGNGKQFDIKDDEILFYSGGIALKYISGALKIEDVHYSFGFVDVKVNDIVGSLDTIIDELGELSEFTRIAIADGSSELNYGKDKRLKYENDNHPELLRNVVNTFEKHNLPIDTLDLYIDNKTYDNIYYLKEINNKYPIKVHYKEGIVPTTYEEFIGMRAALDYYTDLINSYVLSPLEKAMFAYDLMKSFEYNEKETHSLEPRYIPSIISSGEIVCIGYSSFYKQLLIELGIKSKVIHVTVKSEDGLEYHARNLIELEDEKYNIEGTFACDCTWDSYREIYKTGEKIIGKNGIKDDENAERVQGLPLYRYFLVPASVYKEIFKNEDYPQEFFVNDNREKDDKLTKRCFNVKRPDLETFKKALYQVRLCEGYSPEEIAKEIEDVIYTNQYICEHYAIIPFFENVPLKR